MNRSSFAPLVFLLAACAGGPDPAPGPLGEPFDVLLLGDSISIGYTPFVQAALEGRARVVRPRSADGKKAQNCQGTNNGVLRLEDWLAIDDGGWEVIHFNFGLHDLKRVHPESGHNSSNPEDPHQADPLRYEAQLLSITEGLLATGARVVFATTTPVPPKAGSPFRAPEDAVLYNQIAARVMGELGVQIGDLFSLVTEGPQGWQKPQNVHFTREGSKALGEEVARAILQAAGG